MGPFSKRAFKASHSPRPGHAYEFKRREATVHVKPFGLGWTASQRGTYRAYAAANRMPVQYTRRVVITFVAGEGKQFQRVYLCVRSGRGEEKSIIRHSS